MRATLKKDKLIPVFLLVSGQACTVLRVEGGAANLQILHTTGAMKDKSKGQKSRQLIIIYSNINANITFA